MKVEPTAEECLELIIEVATMLSIKEKHKDVAALIRGVLTTRDTWEAFRKTNLESIVLGLKISRGDKPPCLIDLERVRVLGFAQGVATLNMLANEPEELAARMQSLENFLRARGQQT